MYQLSIFILLLADFIQPILSLTQEDLSSSLLLLPQKNTNCAINLGKDGTSGPLHGPEQIFYDGIRCKRRFSRNETTAFIVGKSHSLRDVAEAAEKFGDILSLRALFVGTGNGTRNGTVKCGTRAVKEILFLRASTNGTIRARHRGFEVRMEGFYAFVEEEKGEIEGGLKDVNDSLCLFQGEIRRNEVVNDSNLGSKSDGDAIGITVGWVSSLALIGVIARYVMCYMSEFD